MPTNHQIVIKSLPEDKLEPGNYEARDVPIPEPGEGEVLSRTLYVAITAGTRAGLQGSASYAGAPRTGVVMGGTTLSEVLVSNAPGIAPGDLVLGAGGWQTHSVQKAEHLTVVPPIDEPSHYVGALGTNGLTAYFGLLRLGEPGPGKTVLVSAAAGSVGHLVGQIARIQGARVVGVTGSDAKAAVLTGELGFDAAVNHREDGFRQRLKEATPDGVDIYFDNTGGDILGAALRRMNTHGRIVCCGVVSQYDTANPEPGPRGVPGLLINKRLRMEGFLVFDFAAEYETARADLLGWMQSGDLRPLQDIVEGLDNAPQAFVDLLAGGNLGTRIVRV